MTGDHGHPSVRPLLAGQLAIVTGGASGIGAATSRRFAAHGARVAVLDIDAEGARAVAKEIGGVAHVVDVTDPQALHDAIHRAAADLGGLTTLVSCAGASGLARLHDYSPADWDRLVRLNLSAVFYGIRAAAPLILENGGGSIVSIASISGTRPAAGEGPYAAAKAGVAALTACAALEYAPTVRVNSVSPGMIRTAMTAPALALPGFEENWAKRTPLRRVGEPEDVADVIVFLCSDLARYVTGQNLVIDGGMTLHGSAVDGVLESVLEMLAAHAGDG